MKEVLGEFIDRIYVDYDYTNRKHKVRIELKLPIFDDELVYNNPNKKKEG